MNILISGHRKVRCLLGAIPATNMLNPEIWKGFHQFMEVEWVAVRRLGRRPGQLE
jgi:hypothetical protein